MAVALSVHLATTCSRKMESTRVLNPVHLVFSTISITGVVSTATPKLCNASKIIPLSAPLANTAMLKTI